MIASSSKFRFLSTDFSFCFRSLLSYLIQPNPCTILIGKAVIAFSRPFIDAESLEIFQLRYIHNCFLSSTIKLNAKFSPFLSACQGVILHCRYKTDASRKWLLTFSSKLCFSLKYCQLVRFTIQ